MTPQKSKTKVKAEVSSPDDFKSVARRLECDEDKARFEMKLGKIAKTMASSAAPKTK